METNPQKIHHALGVKGAPFSQLPSTAREKCVPHASPSPTCQTQAGGIIFPLGRRRLLSA
jgi:hypothetical protein